VVLEGRINNANHGVAHNPVKAIRTWRAATVMHILGIHTGHDAAACLLVDGAIIAIAAEERFSRVKHDSGFPAAAIGFCLEAAGLDARDLDIVAIAGAHLPIGMERHLRLSPIQQAIVAAARPVSRRAAQVLRRDELGELPLSVERLSLAPECRLEHVDHHRCHAAAAAFTRSSDAPCLVLTVDGIGDDVSTAVWQCVGGTLEPLARWGREGSMGWFYGIVTEALGWQHGDGEGTTMALAAYGDPAELLDILAPFHPAYERGNLTQPHDFGRAMEWNRHGTLQWHFQEANAIRRLAEKHSAVNIAAAAQEILERQVLDLVRHWIDARAIRRLACAGGVFLNVKLNQRIWYEAGLEEQWIVPDAGDSGLALGAALHAWHAGAERPPSPLEHLSFGPSYGDDEVRMVLDSRRLGYRHTADPAGDAARLLAEGRIVGWFQGRMEAGPRALGNRSILMSPLTASNKDVLNSRVKFREGFRPFCPSIPAEHRATYLDGGRAEDFMITSFRVAPEKHERIPAVVHVDGTLRPQTVRRDVNPLFHSLLDAFGRRTGEFALINTSFNVKGEPIVCHPRDAIRCFFDTGLDALVIGGFVLEKPRSPSCIPADRDRTCAEVQP
jgi:carbamoyltransferase